MTTHRQIMRLSMTIRPAVRLNKTSSGATWRRALFMLISCVLVSVASLVGSLVVVLGFFWVLFSGEVNRQLQQVGQSLASYVYSIICYLTFNTNQKPFPLGGQWPSSFDEGTPD